ncbi:MAG: aminotransferase class III-fold pyridoxal phosphate-dependent enzyme [Pseudomonadota bacterium]
MTETMQNRRERLMGPNVRLFYDEPVHLVRGQGCRVWDADRREYLDCYNNVPHVGHCHPKVVEAISRQAATLNTHTRYLHDGILDYIERLTGKMGPGLDCAILTCTGSEANDIALRMAQAVSGRRGVIATDNTYHGNTSAVTQLSAKMPPIGGREQHVRLVQAPDSLRRPDPGGAAFAAEVQGAIDALDADGIGFSALIICPYFGNEGFPDIEPGWLDEAAAAVRKAGGIVIADEVQGGFGRTGWMWAHEKIGLAPDVVTLGKPMGNGHPVAGVVTSAEIMAAFRNSFSYFNTFGGNPVSAAAAMAVLDVLEEEDLVANAANVGAYAREGLSALAKRHYGIADVRGAGLFFGAEFVLDDANAPATDYARWLAEGMRQRGVLLNVLGRDYNTLKIRPPMPFSRADADQLLDTLDVVLKETPGP